MQKYYYTDKEELDALRAENAKLISELNNAKVMIEELQRQLTINAVILERGAGKNQRGGTKNGSTKKEN